MYFVGASGVGKSTLAAWAAAEFGLPLYKSANSAVYKDAGVTFEQALLDPAVLNQCQREIYHRTLAGLSAMAASDRGLAADRCIDLVVYTPDMLGGWDFYKDWGLERLEALAKDPRALVFFVRPHPDVTGQARATDGGRRSYFLQDGVVRRIDGGIEFFLEDRGVDHVTVDSPRFKDRARLVKKIVSLYG